MEWNSLQTDCPDSARKIWPWSSYRHHPRDGSASCMKICIMPPAHLLEKREHCHGAWRANFHYVLRELRTNLLALIMVPAYGAAESCYSKSGRKRWSLNAEGCPAQSWKHQAAAAQCQLQSWLGSLEPAGYTLCLCKHCGIHLLLPPADHNFCQRDFSDSSPCLYPHSHYMKVICSL